MSQHTPSAQWPLGHSLSFAQCAIVTVAPTFGGLTKSPASPASTGVSASGPASLTPASLPQVPVAALQSPLAQSLPVVQLALQLVASAHTNPLAHAVAGCEAHAPLAHCLVISEEPLHVVVPQLVPSFDGVHVPVPQLLHCVSHAVWQQMPGEPTQWPF